MRYYKIVLTNPTTGKVIIPKSGALAAGQDFTYSSYVGGRTLLGALNIEIDAPLAALATPIGNTYIRIWGISLQEIAQASDLNGAQVTVYAGLQKGLPLATAANAANQAGIIFQGYVFQGFGNWIDTDQTLDLIIQPGTGTIETPKNIIVNWRAGTPLAVALASTLTTAFPALKQNINISSNLVLPNDQTGYYGTLSQFATYIKAISANILKGDYRGVDMSISETTIFAYDGTAVTTPKQINFQDLIGQPTWIDFATIQFKCPMRADISVGSYVKMPQGALVTTSAASLSAFRNKSAFQGTFLVNQVRHTGNYRQPDAASWVTTVDCAAIPAAA